MSEETEPTDDETLLGVRIFDVAEDQSKDAERILKRKAVENLAKVHFGSAELMSATELKNSVMVTARKPTGTVNGQTSYKGYSMTIPRSTFEAEIKKLRGGLAPGSRIL
jgi:hypothetical protein